MLRIFFILLIGCLGHEVSAQKMAVPFQEKNGNWCFVEKYTKRKITPSFDKVKYIKDSVYQVWQGNKVGLYNVFGKEILPIKYLTVPTIIEFGDGMYPLSDNGKIKYFNNKGKVAFEWGDSTYPYTYFINGFLLTPKGFVNKKGKIVIPDYYRGNWFEDNGLCQVGRRIEPVHSYDDSILWGVIDKKNRIIIPLEYRSIDINDDYVVASNDFDADHNICFDLKGKRIIKEMFENLEIFVKSGLYSYTVEKEDDYFQVLRNIKTGKIVTNKYNDYYQLSSGDILTKKSTDGIRNKSYSIIDKNGKVLKHLGKYVYVFEIEEQPGKFLYEDSLENYGVIDRNGKVLMKIPNGFYVVRTYSSGMRIKNNELEGFINNAGKFNIPIQEAFIDYNPEINIWAIETKTAFFYVDERGNKYNDE